MKTKKVVVETCEFCDAYKHLIKCTMCGKKACSRIGGNGHIKSFMYYFAVIGDTNSNNWHYAQNKGVVWLCPGCQQKPFIEVWKFAQSLGWVAR